MPEWQHSKVMLCEGGLLFSCQPFNVIFIDMSQEVPAINRVWVFTLYGEKAEKFDSPQEAVRYIQESPEEKAGHLVRIEIQIRLSSGEMIDGTFNTKHRAINFVENRQF